MEFREAIDQDREDLENLAASIADNSRNERTAAELIGKLALRGNDFRDQERQLEAAAWRLRREWLAAAHRPADTTLKSPCQGAATRVAAGDSVSFGYERDLDVAVLEARGEGYMQAAPANWSRELVLCRSGQAALAALLHLAVSRWGQSGPLTVAHAGAYFETAALLRRWPGRILRPVPVASDAADLVIAEPVWCDGRFGCDRTLPAPRLAMLLDITMVGPTYDLDAHLQRLPPSCSLLIAYSSGLKLDQAGLELANVGIVRIFARSPDQAAGFAADLRALRALIGAGLTFDEFSALSVPWFMDRAYAHRYTTAIFENNQALAEAVGGRSRIFLDRCHPCELSPAARAPFCALRLHDGSPDDYRRLAHIVEVESERRSLLIANGGSFGFRGHRFELIEPLTEQDPTFLRVAMGWRRGYSCQGLCELFADLAAQPSFDALGRAFAA